MDEKQHRNLFKGVTNIMKDLTQNKVHSVAKTPILRPRGMNKTMHVNMMGSGIGVGVGGGGG